MKKKFAGIALASFILATFFNTTAFAKIYTYDSLNRVIQVCSENGTRTNYKYDTSGNMVSAATFDVKSLSLDSSSLNMNPGDLHSIVLKAEYGDGQIIDVTCDAEFSSSDSSIVSVDEFGKVKALKNGQGNVYVKYAGRVLPIDIVVGGTSTDNIKHWEEKTGIEREKQWTIKFTNDIDASTVTDENIRVLDRSGSSVNISMNLENDKKTVVIKSPEHGYEPGKVYYLEINKNVRDIKGNNLKKYINMKFTINP